MRENTETSKPASFWTGTVVLLLLLSVASPLVFGIPILGNYMAMDANFALQLVHGYSTSLCAYQYFPRWLPEGNAGLGSPAFYFYGRLPFLIAALFAHFFHASATAALSAGIMAFRVLAFLTCRAWLRLHFDRFAADLGALVFVGLPYAMSYNPGTRVGYAEIAATALIPILFLLLDRVENTWRPALGWAVPLAFVYAALAATHLPQTVLAFGVACLYGLLAGGGIRLAANLAGAVCGFLLSSPNIWPALRMQYLITPLAWTGGPTGDVRNQFLFTLSRLHLYHFLVQELYLYTSWLLCLAVLLPFVIVRELRQWSRARSASAMLVVLAVCLAAMTKLFWPLWVYFPPLHALQFPWRIFPATMAFAAGATALLAARSTRARTGCLAAVALVIAAQAAVSATGAWVSFSGARFAASIPTVVTERLPHFVAQAQREQPTYAVQRSFVPEYIPAAAREAGWHLDGKQATLLNSEGNGTPQGDRNLPAIAISRSDAGAFVIKGKLPAPASLLLPSFYFPDEQARGSPGVTLSLDRPTGLTRVRLPGGRVQVKVAHDGFTESEKQSYRASFAGAAGILVLLAVWSAHFWKPRRATAQP